MVTRLGSDASGPPPEGRARRSGDDSSNNATGPLLLKPTAWCMDGPHEGSAAADAGPVLAGGVGGVGGAADAQAAPAVGPGPAAAGILCLCVDLLMPPLHTAAWLEAQVLMPALQSAGACCCQA
eukprot:scaffold171715_cov14-Tisochrysis_lutea.AAC.1